MRKIVGGDDRNRLSKSFIIQKIMSIDPEQLKKIKVRYLKCQKGDLHQG